MNLKSLAFLKGSSFKIPTIVFCILVCYFFHSLKYWFKSNAAQMDPFLHGLEYRRMPSSGVMRASVKYETS